MCCTSGFQRHGHAERRAAERAGPAGKAGGWCCCDARALETWRWRLQCSWSCRALIAAGLFGWRLTDGLGLPSNAARCCLA